jgi:hypothetical protein
MYETPKNNYLLDYELSYGSFHFNVYWEFLFFIYPVWGQKRKIKGKKVLCIEWPFYPDN